MHTGAYEVLLCLLEVGGVGSRSGWEKGTAVCVICTPTTTSNGRGCEGEDDQPCACRQRGRGQHGWGVRQLLHRQRAAGGAQHVSAPALLAPPADRMPHDLHRQVCSSVVGTPGRWPHGVTWPNLVGPPHVSWLAATHATPTAQPGPLRLSATSRRNAGCSAAAACLSLLLFFCPACPSSLPRVCCCFTPMRRDALQRNLEPPCCATSSRSWDTAPCSFRRKQ